MTRSAEPLAVGEPLAAPAGYRRALGRYPTGVAVVAAIDSDGRPVGLTINSFASLSLDPPLVLWCIGRASSGIALWGSPVDFGISVLAEDQLPLARRYARRGTQHLDDTDWVAGGTGVPLIDGACSWLECRTERVVDGGDHLMLLGRVARYSCWERAPLVFHAGEFATRGPSLGSR